MKYHEVVGYTADADVWCPHCLPYDTDGQDSEGNDVHPIFAGDEKADEEYCNACHCKLIEE